jgi:hypothetical protein
MPLRSRRLAVIPHGWAAHHRPVTEGAMTAECIITRDREGVAPLDAGTGEPEPWEPLTIYPLPGQPGICRVQILAAGGGESEQAVGEAVAEREVLVVVPHDAPEFRAGRQTGDWVTITAGGDDPQLVGRRLRINTIDYSSLSWERDLRCLDQQTSNNPPPYDP